LIPVRAKFVPRQTSALVSGAAEAIGREGLFVPFWTIDEGPYAGERAMQIPVGWDIMAAWVPEGDLQVVVGALTD